VEEGVRPTACEDTVLERPLLPLRPASQCPVKATGLTSNARKETRRQPARFCRNSRNPATALKGLLDRVLCCFASGKRIGDGPHSRALGAVIAMKKGRETRPFW
jgi:hypothetical protein